jgi:hypothetical protein
MVWMKGAMESKPDETTEHDLKVTSSEQIACQGEWNERAIPDRRQL